MSARRTSRTKWLVSAAALSLKLGASLLVLATPVLGVWVASSLAAYGGKATWLPIVAGLLAFPLAPLAWDAWSEHRRRRKKAGRERILTFADRLLLRTFAVNFTLLALLLALRPSLAFTALSTRGDWMLDGKDGPLATKARSALFAAAGGLGWLYDLSHENRFAELTEGDAPPEPTPTSTTGPEPELAPSAEQLPAPPPAPRPDEPGRETPEPARPGVWPFPGELHRAVRSIPSSEEGSLEQVARYIRANEPNPRDRIKALHDYVADRIAYDAVALAEDRIPAQDAVSVFASRKGVCAGYANLLKAMAKVTGDEVLVVVGDARKDIDEVGGGGHAWNAARIDGKWSLLDATWDAGWVEGRTFNKEYRTDYFMTPPEIFGVDHLPEQDRWQLRERPLSRGEFMRQPMLRAPFFRHGLRLEKPDRSQVTVPDALDIELANPRGAFALARFHRKGEAGEAGERCEVRPGSRLLVRCAFPADAVYRVLLFVGPQEFGLFEQVGTFEAVRRR